MGTSKPAFVFVGGVSHTAEFFDELIDEMKKLGYDSEGFDFPSCGERGKGVSQDDEIAAIQALTLKYLDEKNQDVVLMVHSYGGWPGSRAVKGLDKEAREKAGKSTGIVEYISLSAFTMPENAIGAEWVIWPDWMDVKDNQRIPNEKCIPILFNDMSKKAQEHWLSKFQSHENNFVQGPVTDGPWHIKSLRKTALILMNDQILPPALQFHLMEPVLDETWSFKSLKAGHEPFLSQPANLAKVLVQPTF